MKVFIKALKEKKKTINNKTMTSNYTFSIKPICVSVPPPPTEYKLALKFLMTVFHRLIFSIIMSTHFG